MDIEKRIMLSITGEQLREMIIKSDGVVNSLKLEIHNRRLEIGELNKKQAATEAKLDKELKRLRGMDKAQILNKDIPENVAQLREELIKKMEQVKRKDITIAKAEKLRVEIEELKSALQKSCSHPFVYNKQGFEGSASYDFEDKDPE